MLVPNRFYMLIRLGYFVGYMRMKNTKLEKIAYTTIERSVCFVVLLIDCKLPNLYLRLADGELWTLFSGRK